MARVDRQARLQAVIESVQPLDEQAMAAARQRQDQLTKPLGSLGRLERLATQLAGITGAPLPCLARKAVLVMAADHGASELVYLLTHGRECGLRVLAATADAAA